MPNNVERLQSLKIIFDVTLANGHVVPCVVTLDLRKLDGWVDYEKEPIIYGEYCRMGVAFA